MARKVPEWIGKTEDSKIPPHVKLRIFLRYGGKCAITGRPFAAGETPNYDHIIALINWRKEINGEPHGNRESNIQPLWIPAHKEKSAKEAEERAKVDSIIKKSFGMNTPGKKIPSRGFAKASPKHRATSPVSKLREFMDL